MANPELEQGLARLTTLQRLLTYMLPAAGLGFAAQGLSDLLESRGLVDLEAPSLSPLSTAVALLNLGQFLLFLGCVLVVGMWCYRGHANLVSAGYHKQFTPGSSVWWFFVPFANLVMPFRAMHELWQLSHGIEYRSGDSAPPEMTMWWGAWLGGNFVSSGAQRIAAAGILFGGILGLLGGLASAAAAFLLLRVVNHISTAQMQISSVAETFA